MWLTSSLWDRVSHSDVPLSAFKSASVCLWMRQVKSSQVKPSQAKSSQAKSSQAKPSQVKPSPRPSHNSHYLIELI